VGSCKEARWGRRFGFASLGNSERQFARKLLGTTGKSAVPACRLARLVQGVCRPPYIWIGRPAILQARDLSTRELLTSGARRVTLEGRIHSLLQPVRVDEDIAALSLTDPGERKSRTGSSTYSFAHEPA
jgi:hypothetical protein